MTRVPGWSIAVAVLLAAWAASEARAQEDPDTLGPIHMPPIVVTATRTPAPPEELGSSISVVTRREIERRRLTTLLDALRSVPGVAIAQSGPGGVASAFLRGAGADHTLVLLDGVELNDPSAPNAGYDLAHLSLEAVERIEIVRGPQSTVHGSSAMGGVIHVLTRRGEGLPAPRMALEGGSHGTYRATFGLAGGTDRVDYAAALVRRRTEGVSAATAIDAPAERDGHRVDAFTGRLGWRPAADVELDVSLRVTRAETDRDQEGPGGDDPNAVTGADELSLRAATRFEGPDGGWRVSVAAGFLEHNRSSTDEVDERRPLDRSRGTFDGRKWKLEGLAEIDLAEAHRLILGLEDERETAATTFRSEGEFGPFESRLPEESARTTAAFVQHRAGLGGGLFVAAGARVDHHDRFGAAGTFRLAPVLRIAPTGTRLKASWGTGFKAPTLLQLFDPEFGNADLDPEESHGWDAGVEQDLLAGRLRLAATAFRIRFEDLVAFEFPAGFRNLSAARTRGVEVEASALPGRGIVVRGSYTRTRTQDDSRGPDDGRPLIRRPRHQASIDVAAPIAARGDVSLGLRLVGARADVDFSIFPSRRVTLDPYATVRLTGSWRLAGPITLFGRIENFLDEEYEEVLHFATPGREVFVGARADL